MISLSVYKLIHLAAIFALLAIVGGAAMHAANGGRRQDNVARALAAALHGVALLLILVSGFGQLARLGIEHDWLFPGWIWGKLLIWLLFAFALSLPYRKPLLAKPLLWTAPLLAAFGGFLALFKPL